MMHAIATTGASPKHDENCDAGGGDYGEVDVNGFLGVKEDASGLMVGGH